MKDQYHLLNEGEIYREGDEFYDYRLDTWRSIAEEHIGLPHSDYVNGRKTVVRRKNPEFFYEHEKWI